MNPPAAVNMPVCRETDRFMKRANLRTWLRFQWIHVTLLSLWTDPVCLRPTVLAPHEWNGAALAPGLSWLLWPKSALACRGDLLMKIKGLSPPHTHTQNPFSVDLFTYIVTVNMLNLKEHLKKIHSHVLQSWSGTPDSVLMSYCPIRPHSPQRRAIWAEASDS